MTSDMTLGGFAHDYEGNNFTKNISDLECFDVGMPVYRFDGETGEGKKFTYMYIEDKNGVRYRIPWTVIDYIKNYRQEEPLQVLFKVKKNGTGLDTKYTVFPVKE